MSSAKATLTTTTNHWAQNQARLASASRAWADAYVVASGILAAGLWAGNAALGMALFPEPDTLLSPLGGAVGAGASLTNMLSGVGFLRYVSIVLWLVCVSTGLLSEVVLGQWLVEHVSESTGDMLWRGAQLLFALFVSVGLFSASAFGLPFAVLGLWKCGFPETIACFQEAFLEASERRINLAAACAYLNGLGTLLHHSAAAYCIVAVATHLCPLSRPILALSLPLVLQHVVVLLRYRTLALYGLIELLLEIFFETELFAALPELTQTAGYDATIRGCAMTMLLAHWLYWAAAVGKGLDMLTSLDRPAADTANTLPPPPPDNAYDAAKDPKDPTDLKDSSRNSTRPQNHQLTTGRRLLLVMRHAASLDVASGRVTDFAVARRTEVDDHEQDVEDSRALGGAVTIVARGSSTARASIRRSGSTREEREAVLARPLHEAAEEATAEP